MVKTLRSIGVTSDMAYLAAMLSIGGSILAWFTAKKKADRAEGERWGLFLGLWAPTFMEIGNALKVEEET